MAVYAGARQVQILIGADDFTDVFVSGEGSDSHWDENGLIKTQFRLRFQMRAGFPYSLDDRFNLGRYYRGQSITINVANESGVLVRHPRGALRLLTSQYEPSTQVLEIEAGCLLTLYDGREATNPDDVADTVGTSRTYNQVLEQILGALGLFYTLDSPTNYYIAAPLQVQGSLTSMLGQVCASIGLVGWIDGTETFRTKPLPENVLGSAIALNIGQDEVNQARLQGADPPPQLVILSGDAKVRIPGANTGTIEDSTTEELGDGAAIDPSLEGSTVVLLRTTVLDEWNSGATVRTRTETRYEPRGIVSPKSPAVNASNRAQLTISEVKTVVETYESEDEGRLLSRLTTVDRPRSIACRNFADFHANNNTADWQAVLGEQVETLVSPAERTIETYTYDAQTGLLARLVTTREDTYDAILGGAQEDWQAWYDTYSSWPEELRVGEERREVYSKRSGRQVRQTLIRQPYAAAFPEAASTADPPLDREQKVALRLVRSPREYSNSGQLQPPAPERAPLLYDFEDKRVSSTLQAFFSGGFGRAREKAVSIPYLAGLQRSYGQGDFFQDVALDGSPSPTAQLQNVARPLTAIFVGRFYGEQITLPLRDDVCLAYAPLLGFSLTYPDGRKSYYAFDGTSWALESDRTLISTDAIWYGGELTDGSMVLPYTEARPLSSAFELAASLGWIPGDPTATYGLTQAIEYAPRVAVPLSSVFELSDSLGFFGDDMSFTGTLICAGECSLSATQPVGKAFEFDAAGTFLATIAVDMDFASSIQVGSQAIEIHRWSQEPNTALTGRTWWADLPETGGNVLITTTTTYRWITIQVRKQSNGLSDTVCFKHSGNAFTIMEI